LTLAVLAVASGVAAALVATRAGRPWAYGVAKAIASGGFVAAALVAGALGGDWGRWALVALVLSGVGDVVLAVRARWAFVAGLGAFLVAHAVYAIAFVLRGVEPLPLAGASLGLALAATWGWRSGSAWVPPALRRAVLAYLVVVSAMVATGVSVGVTHGAPGLALGAVLVVGSDLAVARERFVRPGFVNKALGLPTYYLGQLLIAVSLGAG
jgi:uncharacterized membrane protein YhhN